MKSFTILATILSITASVAAQSCNRGGSYCGISLLRRDDWRQGIIDELQANNQPTDEPHIQNSRFDCVENNGIEYREFCASGCGGADSEDPDYCF